MQESLEHLDLWVPVALLDPLENLEMMVRLESLANRVSVDLLDPRGLVDFQELLAYLESRVTEVIQVLMVQRERLELLGLRVNLVPREKTALLAPWDLVVCLAREAVLDPVASLVPVVMTACLVPLVPQAQ